MARPEFVSDATGMLRRAASADNADSGGGWSDAQSLASMVTVVWRDGIN